MRLASHIRVGLDGFSVEYRKQPPSLLGRVNLRHTRTDGALSGTGPVHGDILEAIDRWQSSSDGTLVCPAEGTRRGPPLVRPGVGRGRRPPLRSRRGLASVAPHVGRLRGMS